MILKFDQTKLQADEWKAKCKRYLTPQQSVLKSKLLKFEKHLATIKLFHFLKKTWSRTHFHSVCLLVVHPKLVFVFHTKILSKQF